MSGRSARDASATGSDRIFAAVHKAYGASGGRPMSNKELYRVVRKETGISEEAFSEKQPVGKSGARHAVRERTARWTQQTMRARGLLRRVDGKRGVWELTEVGKARLTKLAQGSVMVAFSTKLGVALWGDCRDALKGLGEPIHLCLTSAPYPLAKQRAYGNPEIADYVDWLCTVMEPVVANMAPGASLVLNVDDVFLPGTPARAMIPERVSIALNERLGLYKMQTLIWHNASKAPGPIAWASKQRVQLNFSYEPLLWYTNDPAAVFSDNRRVLQPHTERHKAMMRAGGEKRSASYADGAHVLRPSSFANETPGRIPRDVISQGHSCASWRACRKAAADAGLPLHGAGYPVALARFIIEFMTEPGHLVVDNMAGWLTTPVAAEATGRRWIAVEQFGQYVAGGSLRFKDAQLSEDFGQMFPMLKAEDDQ